MLGKVRWFFLSREKMTALQQVTLSKLLAMKAQSRGEGNLIVVLTTIGNFKLSRNGGPTSITAWNCIDAEKEMVWGTSSDFPIQNPRIHWIANLHARESLLTGCFGCNKFIECSHLKNKWQLGTIALEINGEKNKIQLMVAHCSPFCANEFRALCKLEGRVDAEQWVEEQKTEFGPLSFLFLFDESIRDDISLRDIASAREYFQLYFGSLQTHLSGQLCSTKLHKKDCTKLLKELRQFREENRISLSKSTCLFTLPLEDHVCEH